MYMLKRSAAFITAAILSVIPITALAATGTQISSVSLYISSEIEAGESGSDVTVTSSSSISVSTMLRLQINRMKNGRMEVSPN